MRPSRAMAVGLLLATFLVVATGCSRLTFVKPDMTRGAYTQTAPEVQVSDAGRRGSMVARDSLLLAHHRFASGDLDQARKHAQAALKADPASADAHTLLALVAQRAGQMDKAGGHYRQAAELAPQRGDTLNNYGTWLCGNGQAAGSLAWFDRALAAPGYRTPADALANAGSCALRAGQVGRAERDLRRSIQMDPRNAVALGAMAALEYGRGNAFEARAFSQRRLAAAPADADALRLASQIEHKLGDIAASERYRHQLQAEFGDATSAPSGE